MVVQGIATGCGAHEPVTVSRSDARRPPTETDPPSASACVFQILRRHFSRYTPEMVEDVLRDSARPVPSKVAETLCANSGRERTSAFCYAVGWTQHSVGVQYIRTAAIIQLLLGNMGRPGGGIMALRGHASIQGSTDIPTLYNLLPGYLPMPKAANDTTFAELYREQHAAFRLVERVPQVFCLAARRPGSATPRRRKRLVLRLSARAHRRSFAHDTLCRHGRRQGEGLFRDGRESGGRLYERPASSRGTAATRLAGGPRFRS